MSLAELLKQEHVLLGLPSETKEDTINKMVEKMQETGVVTEPETFKEAVNAREVEGSTGIGYAVAIPHGKSTGVAEASLAFARLANEVDWQSLDGNPVSYVFLIAIPEEQAGKEHLQILSQLSRKLMHEEFRAKLAEAEDSKELIAALEE
ncbi:PTS fructose transporter subunit IIA [Halalkalibacillus sediminis]|uniref:PTS fructose transporter subunit IIA n=1 Tax=Halalkalibacillus sediminis TaxID=2018042 RepID=A0A2I0QTR3_9BACI|nr:fructose PTS transporter subunit IIA [Halalkalibacillus sediminis]PKR77698.1 PTS fructose transporter subunit IIA [Halalkalibacillus sediminis]